MDKIPCLISITKDSWSFGVFDFFEKYRDNSCFAMSILSWSVDICIAKYSRVNTILSLIEAEKKLDRTLRNTIGCLGVGNMLLRIGRIITAKHRSSSRRKNDTFTMNLLHCLENIQGSQYIYFDIPLWIFDRFTDIDLCCQMKDNIGNKITHNKSHSLTITDISFTYRQANVIFMSRNIVSRPR